MNGLRSFIELDYHSAVEVATCAKASGLSKICEDHSEVLREGADDLTQRASQKAHGQNNFADTWTTSRRSTSPTPHHGTRGTV